MSKARSLIVVLGILTLSPYVVFADGYQAYSTPGTYSFAVPSYGTMSVVVNGAGGGGGGATSCQYGYVGGTGGTGGTSVFYSNTNMIAYGGAGGQGNYVSGSSCVAGADGAPGTASGGDTNTTGGGGYGGAGGRLTPLIGGSAYGWVGAGNGGAGGSASKTYSAGVAGAPAAGTTLTIVVGAGGAGGATNGYLMNTSGSPGSNGGVSVSWTTPPPPSCSISITPNPLAYGSSATVSWSSTNATSFYINSIGYVSGVGSTSVTPGATTNYSGSVSGPGGNGSCPATLVVNPPSSPSASITPSSSTIYLGQSTTITATFAVGSGDVLLNDNIDSPVGTGLGSDANPTTPKSITFTPTSTGTYTFYARARTQYYSSWTTYAQTTVTVLPAPQCTIALSPTTISPGQNSTLTYSSSNATTFSVNSVGPLTPNTSGSVTVSPARSTDYTGTATAGGYSRTCTAPGTTPPGTLTVSCNPSYSCSGQTIQRTDSSCNVNNVTTCIAPTFCSAGSATCLYPAPAFNPNGTLTGHLQVVPSLVAVGGTVTVNWNLSNVSSCAVTGSNGDSWNGASGKKTSSIITTRTVYTLSCTGLDGSTVQETQTVSVAPAYRER